MIEPTKEELYELIDLSDLMDDSKILIKKALYMLENYIREDEVMEILRRSAMEEITCDEAIAELDRLSKDE